MTRNPWARENMLIFVKSKEEAKQLHRMLWLLEVEHMHGTPEEILVFDGGLDPMGIGALLDRLEGPSPPTTVITTAWAATGMNFWPQCYVLLTYVPPTDCTLMQMLGRSHRKGLEGDLCGGLITDEFVSYEGLNSALEYKQHS